MITVNNTLLQEYFVFTVFCRYCGFFLSFFFFFFFFYKVKICVNFAWSKSIDAIFLTAFAHLVSLCYNLISLLLFQIFSSLLYLWWPRISDIWCSYHNCFGASWSMPVLVSEPNICVLTAVPLPFSLSSGLPIPWNKAILKLDQLKTL